MRVYACSQSRSRIVSEQAGFPKESIHSIRSIVLKVVYSLIIQPVRHKIHKSPLAHVVVLLVAHRVPFVGAVLGIVVLDSRLTDLLPERRGWHLSGVGHLASAAGISTFSIS